jgi:hypothetical protein
MWSLEISISLAGRTRPWRPSIAAINSRKPTHCPAQFTRSVDRDNAPHRPRKCGVRHGRNSLPDDRPLGIVLAAFSRQGGALECSSPEPTRSREKAASRECEQILMFRHALRRRGAQLNHHRPARQMRRVTHITLKNITFLTRNWATRRSCSGRSELSPGSQISLYPVVAVG